MRKLSLYAQTPVRLAAAAAAQQVALLRHSVETELASLAPEFGRDALGVAGEGNTAEHLPPEPRILCAEEEAAARYVSLVRRAISTDLRELEADLRVSGWRVCLRDAKEATVEVRGIQFEAGEQRRT